MLRARLPSATRRARRLQTRSERESIVRQFSRCAFWTSARVPVGKCSVNVRQRVRRLERNGGVVVGDGTPEAAQSVPCAPPADGERKIINICFKNLDSNESCL